MTNATPWQRFIARTTKGYEQHEIAKRTGVSPATVSRWLNRTTGTADHVITIARAFNDDPTLALVDTGFLTVAEATRSEVTPEELLARIDELELAREIVRRLEEGEAGEALADEAPVSNVTAFPVPDVSGQHEDEWDARHRAAAKDESTITDRGSDEGFDG